MAAVPSIEAMVQQKLRNSQISSLGNPDMLDAAGTSFDDLYSLVDVRLGDGMTACVYAAVEKRTGRTLVCKLAEKRAKRGAWDRLSHLMRHESILLQQLVPHPNIVSMFGFFSSESRSAIMLDLVPGGDCQQLLQRRGALPESDVQAMITQLHAALRCVRHGSLRKRPLPPCTLRPPAMPCSFQFPPCLVVCAATCTARACSTAT
jgi:hypothetical protein